MALSAFRKTVLGNASKLAVFERSHFASPNWRAANEGPPDNALNLTWSSPTLSATQVNAQR
jgi:hypothetical protein